jgi:hypothetical protein
VSAGPGGSGYSRPGQGIPGWGSFDRPRAERTLVSLDSLFFESIDCPKYLRYLRLLFKDCFTPERSNL